MHMPMDINTHMHMHIAHCTLHVAHCTMHLHMHMHMRIHMHMHVHMPTGMHGVFRLKQSSLFCDCYQFIDGRQALLFQIC